MKVCYGLCSFGLGHATRSLPIIRKLVAEGHEVTVVSTGRSLKVINEELGEAVQLVDIPDYHIPYSNNPLVFHLRVWTYAPRFGWDIHREHGRFGKLLAVEGFDRIISDNRYGLYDVNVPSYFIGHQLRILDAKRRKFIENGTERFTRFFQKKFRAFMVPDYEDDDISGVLSHDLNLVDMSRVHYVGALSDFKKRRFEQDLDLLISISGPEPQRTFFEEKVMAALPELDGKINVTLGKSEAKDIETRDGIEIFTYLNKEEREQQMNRARMVVSRSGYTTLMDLAVLGKKALFVPTPGQTEQEYLSEYHNKKETWFSVDQDELDLVKHIEEARKFSGFTRECSSEDSVEKVLEITGIG